MAPPLPPGKNDDADDAAASPPHHPPPPPPVVVESRQAFFDYVATVARAHVARAEVDLPMSALSPEEFASRVASAQAAAMEESTTSLPPTPPVVGEALSAEDAAMFERVTTAAQAAIIDSYQRPAVEISPAVRARWGTAAEVCAVVLQPVQSEEEWLRLCRRGVMKAFEDSLHEEERTVVKAVRHPVHALRLADIAFLDLPMAEQKPANLRAVVEEQLSIVEAKASAVLAWIKRTRHLAGKEALNDWPRRLASESDEVFKNRVLREAEDLKMQGRGFLCDIRALSSDFVNEYVLGQVTTQEEET